MAKKTDFLKFDYVVSQMGLFKKIIIGFTTIILCLIAYTAAGFLIYKNLSGALDLLKNHKNILNDQFRGSFFGHSALFFLGVFIIFLQLWIFAMARSFKKWMLSCGYFDLSSRRFIIKANKRGKGSIPFSEIVAFQIRNVTRLESLRGPGETGGSDTVITVHYSIVYFIRRDGSWWDLYRTVDKAVN